MIHVLCPNPAIDKLYAIDGFSAGEDYPGQRPTVRFGGKGVNVARVLSQLGAGVHLYAFMGEESEMGFRREMEKRCACTFVPVAGACRTTANIIDRKNGREAVTHWSVLGRYPGYTHVQCKLETGRTHQIRVHLASIGHPLLGDVVYGSKKPWPGLAGQCLHARRLKFVHPSTGALVELECPRPEWFEKVLKQIDK